MVENTILRLRCNCPCRIKLVDLCITRRSRPEDNRSQTRERWNAYPTLWIA